MKKNIAILFGGKSAEHEVSLLSAKNIIAAIDKDKFTPILIGITKDGVWKLQDINNFLINDTDPLQVALVDSSQEIILSPGKNKNSFTILENNKITSAIEIDAIFPILHGTFGEDGTMQGLIKQLGVPFVGPSVLGSSVGMDKEITKRVLRDSGIPVGRFYTVNSSEDPNDTAEAAIRDFGIPLFVKPANAGSSVGVQKVKNKEDIFVGIDFALQFDTKVLIEEFLPGREIEVAVLGNFNSVSASIPGEIRPTHEFYSYDAKYVDQNGAELLAPAPLSGEEIALVQNLATRSFLALGLEGMARVDFFLLKDGTFLVNEVNTIPGFTKISMYPKLWSLSGIPYTELITQLIELGIERFERDEKLIVKI